MKNWNRGWLVFLLLLSGWTWSGPIDRSASLTEPGKVGKLDQNSIPGFTTLVPNPTCALGVTSMNFGCAPTATTNSLVYLDQRYGSIYGRSLIPRAQDAILQSDLRDVAVVLGTRMNTHAPATYFVDFLLGKESYIESVAPGKTDYDAQMDPRVRFLADEQRRGIVPPSWMQQRAPTIEFLLDNLKQDEDIELVAVKFERDANGNLVQVAGH